MILTASLLSWLFAAAAFKSVMALKTMSPIGVRERQFATPNGSAVMQQAVHGTRESPSQSLTLDNYSNLQEAVKLPLIVFSELTGRLGGNKRCCTDAMAPYVHSKWDGTTSRKP
jgi:hypothetical protein